MYVIEQFVGKRKAVINIGVHVKCESDVGKTSKLPELFRLEFINEIDFLFEILVCRHCFEFRNHISAANEYKHGIAHIVHCGQRFLCTTVNINSCSLENN